MHWTKYSTTKMKDFHYNAIGVFFIRSRNYSEFGYLQMDMVLAKGKTFY